jgi:hypothetical protein
MRPHLDEIVGGNLHRENYQGMVLVRTQGRRSETLQTALQSIAAQTVHCFAVVVVHGTETEAREVRRQCEQEFGLDFMVLVAADRTRKRGYPLNVALRWCRESAPRTALISFLDDDDRIYPFFVEEMIRAASANDADAVYCASLCRVGHTLPVPAYGGAPAVHVFKENFIANNSLAIRASRLLADDIWFDESLDYVEDWQFLLQLLSHGYRLTHYPLALCEFSSGSDGNTPAKRNPVAWKTSSLSVRRFINKSEFRVNGSLLAGMAHSIEPDTESFDLLHAALRDQAQEINRLREQLTHLQNRVS